MLFLLFGDDHDLVIQPKSEFILFSPLPHQYNFLRAANTPLSLFINVHHSLTILLYQKHDEESTKLKKCLWSPHSYQEGETSRLNLGSLAPVKHNSDQFHPDKYNSSTALISKPTSTPLFQASFLAWIIMKASGLETCLIHLYYMCEC